MNDLLIYFMLKSWFIYRFIHMLKSGLMLYPLHWHIW